MPTPTWKCDKCGHVYDEEKIAKRCENSHISLSVNGKTVTETFRDMEQFPITLTFKGCFTNPEVMKIITYTRTEIKND